MCKVQIVIYGHAVNALAIIVLGGIIGFICGAFGVGGGFLLTPMLHVVLGIPYPIAIGSNLSQMIGTSTAAFLRHKHYGHVDMKLALTIIIPMLVGVEWGAWILESLKHHPPITIGGHTFPALSLAMNALFATLLICVAIGMAREAYRHLRTDAHDIAELRGILQEFTIPPIMSFPDSGVQRLSLVSICIVSGIIGAARGLLGIGGVFMLPALVYSFGVPTHTAIGVNLVAVLASAIYGGFTHALKGNVDLRLVMLMLVSSTIMAQVGAHITTRARPAELRLAFSGIVLIAALLVLWKLWMLWHAG